MDRGGSEWGVDGGGGRGGVGVESVFERWTLSDRVRLMLCRLCRLSFRFVIHSAAYAVQKINNTAFHSLLYAIAIMLLLIIMHTKSA